MRVLMLSQFYPPIMGGEEQHVRTLSLALAARGHHVAVATLSRPGLAEHEMDQGVHVHRIKSTTQRLSWLYQQDERPHAPPIPDPETLLGLRQVVDHERPDLVHAHNWLLHSFLPIKQWSRARLVVTLHDYSLVCVQKRLMYLGERCDGPAFPKCAKCAANTYGYARGTATLLGNWLMNIPERRLVDLFIAVSQATAAKSGLAETGLPFKVIPNFILDEQEPEEYRAEKYLAQLPPEGFMLYVGDVVPDKGIHVLLQAYSELRNAPPLVIIGRMTAHSPREFPAGVRVLGSWPHYAVMQAWKRSSIGILPSLVQETFGLVVLEAMSMARPVIASRIGGIPDVIVNGESGILVPPGDSTALRMEIERLLEDDERRERMGQASLARSLQFRASIVVPRIEQVYQEVSGRVEQDSFGTRTLISAHIEGARSSEH